MKQLVVLILTLIMTTACAPGPKGDKGDQGADGSSCSVVSVEPAPAAPYGGALVTCDDTSAIIANGAPGADGAPAPASLYQITKIIKPCPGLAGSHREVLLAISGGGLLASFSAKASGDNTRLAFVSDGNFVTTDGSGCGFTVSGNVVSWVAGGAGSVSY